MDNQTLLRQLYQDFNARRIDAVLAHMHKDVSWASGWEGGYVSGHEDVRAYWLRQWQQIDPAAFIMDSDGIILTDFAGTKYRIDFAGQLL